jgi:hypothetical protein
VENNNGFHFGKTYSFFSKTQPVGPTSALYTCCVVSPLIPTSPISRDNPLSCNATQIEEAEGAWRRGSGGCEVGALFLVLVLLLARQEGGRGGDGVRVRGS